MQLDRLLAMDHLQIVNPGCGIVQEVARIAEDGRHRGDRYKVLLVDEPQFRRIKRVVAEAQCKSVQHGVALVVMHGDIGKCPVPQNLIIDWHGVSVR